MFIYVLTDEDGYHCLLLGIYDSKDGAEGGRKNYLEANDTLRLGRAKENLRYYVMDIEKKLARNFYRDPSVSIKILEMSGEERLQWWIGINYTIRKLELNTPLDIMLYCE